VAENLYPFQSALERPALRDALNAAGPLTWQVRDSIYYGVYLRAWHERAGKLRIYGDGPRYVLDMNDDPPAEVASEIQAYIATKLVPLANATRDPSALEMLPFPAAPLDLYDEAEPRTAPTNAELPWRDLADAWRTSDPALTVVALQVGTPTSFYSENPRQPEGHHFDSAGPGTTDIEIDLHSPELAARMFERTPQGAPDQRIMRSGKWAFFQNEGPAGFYRTCPQLLVLARKWSDRLERDIEFRLRLSADPVSSVKTPGKGGPIELFRIEAARAPAATPPPPRRGLWQRIRAALGGDSPRAAAPGTIEVDGVRVRRWLQDGTCETVTWDTMIRVEIMTTDEGPGSDDVFWVLHGEQGGCVIPSEAPGADALVPRLQALPGFDHEAMIEAMQSTQNARFLVWSREN